MSEYYGVDSGVPTSGTISMSQFYGTGYVPGSITYTSVTTTTWYAPSNVTSVNICMIGGGGGGAERGRAEDAYCGGGHRGAYYTNSSYPVIPGVGYTVKVGAGGVRVSQSSGTAGTSSQFSGTVVAGGAGGNFGYLTSSGYTGNTSTTSCYGTYSDGTDVYQSTYNNMFYGGQAGFYTGPNALSGVAGIRGSGGAGGDIGGVLSTNGGAGLVRIIW